MSRKISEVIQELEGKISATQLMIDQIKLEKPTNYLFKKAIATFTTIFIISIIPYIMILYVNTISPFFSIGLILVFDTMFLFGLMTKDQFFIFPYLSESLDIKRYHELSKQKDQYENMILNNYAQIDVLTKLDNNHTHTI